MIGLHSNSSKKTHRQKLYRLSHWPFNQTVASSALWWLLIFVKCCLRLYTMEYKSILLLLLLSCFNIWKHEYKTNFEIKKIHGLKHWLLVLLVFVSLSFLWNDVSTLCFFLFFIQYQNMNTRIYFYYYFFYKHSTIDSIIHFPFSMWSRWTHTNRENVVQHKIKIRHTFKFFSICLCAPVCVCTLLFDYSQALFLLLFIWLGVIYSENRILNNESRACKLLPFILCILSRCFFNQICDVNICTIQFLSIFLFLSFATHIQIVIFLFLFFCYILPFLTPFTNLLSAFCTTFFSVLWFHMVVFSFEIVNNILIAVSDIESFNSNSKWKEIGNWKIE